MYYSVSWILETLSINESELERSTDSKVHEYQYTGVTILGEPITKQAYKHPYATALYYDSYSTVRVL